MAGRPTGAARGPCSNSCGSPPPNPPTIHGSARRPSPASSCCFAHAVGSPMLTPAASSTVTSPASTVSPRSRPRSPPGKAWARPGGAPPASPSAWPWPSGSPTAMTRSPRSPSTTCPPSAPPSPTSCVTPACCGPAAVPARSSCPSRSAAAGTATAGASARSVRDARSGSISRGCTRSVTVPDAGVRTSRCRMDSAGPAACTSIGTDPAREHRHGLSCGWAEISPRAWRCGPADSATSPRTRKPERRQRPSGRQRPRSHPT